LFSNKKSVVLARLVETFEMIDLKSINFNPKTRAHSKNNIKRVLGYLRDNKPDIPANVLHCEDEIFDGVAVNIAQILVALGRKYKYKLDSMEKQQ
jgi:hypothetical protein